MVTYCAASLVSLDKTVQLLQTKWQCVMWYFKSAAAMSHALINRVSQLRDDKPNFLDFSAI